MKENDNLKRMAAKGLFWGGISNVIQQVLNLGFGIFLARILAVEDYAIVAMLTIFASLANAIQESGFRSAITNRKNVSHSDYNSVFWVSLMLGVLMYVALFYGVKLIAIFFHEPQLVPLGRFLFLGFLFASTGTAHNAYLFKNLKVKEMAIATLTASIISGTIALIMAIFGMAYWGIAAQNVIYILVSTLIFWKYSQFRPSFKFSLQPVREMFPFSIKLLITTVFHILNEYFFTIILGHFFKSKLQLGYYTNGYKWTNIGTQTISLAIENVMQPVLSKAEDDSLLKVFCKLLQVTAFISFPCMIGLGFVAPEFIEITIGNKWLPSATIMTVLCVWGAFFPLCQVYQKQLLSAGHSGTMMFCVISRCIVQLIVVALTFRYGILTMVISGTLANILSILVVHYFVNKLNGITLLELIKNILPFFISIIISLTSSQYISTLFEGVWIVLIVKVLATATIYITILWLSGNVILKETINFLRGIKN